MVEQLEWMRAFNQSAAQPLHFYGLDLSGPQADSFLPTLDSLTTLSADIDPEAAPILAALHTYGERLAPSAATTYQTLLPTERQELAQSFRALEGRLDMFKDAYVAAVGEPRWAAAKREARLAGIVVEQYVRTDFALRDRALADSVRWLLARHPGERIVIAGHNEQVAQILREQPQGPLIPMGVHLKRELGADYVSIGTTAGTGSVITGADRSGVLQTAELGAPRPNSLDGVLQVAGLALVDMRALLAEGETSAWSRIDAMRVDQGYMESRKQHPPLAFDAIVHLPVVQPVDRAWFAEQARVQVAMP